MIISEGGSSIVTILMVEESLEAFLATVEQGSHNWLDGHPLF